MATAVIGALRVNLSADTAAFSRGLTEAERRAETFGKRIGTSVKVLGSMAAAATAAGAALAVALTKNSLETIDAQSKLAKRVGGTTAAIQALQHAAELAGVGQEQLSKALDMLNARLGEAAREGAGPAYEALQRLGLSARELSDMDADERIKALADRMSELGYTTQQQADVLRQFGIRGGELINLFQEGSPAIVQARRDLEAWGVALSDVDASRVEAANDAISRISTVLQGVGNQLAVAISPYVNALATGLTDAARESHGFERAIASAVQTIGSGLAQVADRLHQIRFLFASIEAFDAGLRARVASINPLLSTDQANAFIAAFKDARAEVDRLATMKLPSEQFDEWVRKAEEARVMTERFSTAFASVGKPNPDGEDDQTSEADAAAAAALQEQLAAKLATLQESLLTEREAELNNYAQRQIDLQDFYNKGMISAQDYADMRVRIEQQHADDIRSIDEDLANKQRRLDLQKIDSALDVAGQVAGALGSLFEDNKGVAIATALINTAQAITKNLATYPGPLGFAAAAAAAAAGYAQVRQIMSTSKNSRSAGGAASGGSTAPAAAASAPAASQSRQVDIRIAGAGIGEMFSGKTIRELLEKINEQLDDGATLRIT